MNWIGTWCKNRCGLDRNCDHCTETCIPRIRIANAVNCSEHLIWILMNQDNGMTHPNIANAIAEFMGATAEQRDSIVHSKYRGTWQPNDKSESKRGKHYGIWNASPVVAVNRRGNIIKRFSSMKSAARYMNCSPYMVHSRCNRTYLEKDEFDPIGVTFRLEAEWSNMTQQERFEDISKRRKQFE